MKQILFFALKSDLVPLLEEVESDCLLKYVQTGNKTTAHFEEFLKCSKIRNLGTASAE